MKAKTQSGFTLIELSVVLAMAGLLSAVLAPGLARTQVGSRSAQCVNHLRELTLGWHQYAEDNNGGLLDCVDGSARPNWVTGNLDFSGSNSSNWDTNRDLVKSPLWGYVGGAPSVFRCPADPATVINNGVRRPRVRSISMSHVFGAGAWLDRSYNPNQKVWRTYQVLGSIIRPTQTFVFADEHPDSMNDSALSSACTGNQPGDSPGVSSIIDYPANYHNGACGFSFADGHADIHKWLGNKIARMPTTFTAIPLNVAALDSWVDMHWLAANTTVRN